MTTRVARWALAALLAVPSVVVWPAAAPAAPMPPAPPTAPEPPDDPDPADDEGTPTRPITLPDTDAGRMFAWVLDAVNGDQPVGDPADHFTPEFLDSAGGRHIRDRLTRLRRETFAGRLVQVVAVERQDSADAMAFTMRGEGARTVLTAFLVLDPRSGKIAGLQFTSPPPGAGGDVDAPRSFGELGGAMGNLGGGSSLGVYELVTRTKDDPTGVAGSLRLAAVYEYGDAQRHNVNAAAQLFPVCLLAGQVRAGTLGWDAKIPIRDDLKSLPGSAYYDLPAGEERTVAEVSTATMSGDFTAGDHLVAFLRPQVIEEWLRDRTPELAVNTPFLTTRQAYTIKLAADRTLLARYDAADAVDRLELLRGPIARAEPDGGVAAAIDAPLAIDRIGWFASVRDLARVWADLRELEQQPGMEPLHAIMRAGPEGLPLNRTRWTDSAYKGGQEPGVMAMTWLLQRDDGRWFVVAATWNDPVHLLDQPKFFKLAASGLDILTKFEGGDNPPAPLESQTKRKGPKF